MADSSKLTKGIPVEEGSPQPREIVPVVLDAEVVPPAKADQGLLLKRSLAVTAKAVKLALKNPEMDEALRVVVFEMTNLITDWASLAEHLGAEAESKGEEVARLEEIVAVQRHRIALTAELLGEMTLLAKKDKKTGAWNEVALDEVGQKVFDKMQEDKKPMACIYLDLDFFKLINDEHSHDAGDHVLRELVRIIGEQSRLSDFLFRMGGAAEEFCILLPETNTEGAVILAERIRDFLEKNPINYEGKQIRVTASIGVAEADFSKDTGWKDVQKRADVAQKDAKQIRNTTASYDDAGSTVRSPTSRYIPDATLAQSRYATTQRARRGEAD